jgi:hypothetical protein
MTPRHGFRMIELTPYLEVADKLGVLVGGVLLVVALYKKWLVFGWLYKECDDARTLCRTQVETRAAKIEADLDRIRAERGARPGD